MPVITGSSRRHTPTRSERYLKERQQRRTSASSTSAGASRTRAVPPARSAPIARSPPLTRSPTPAVVAPSTLPGAPPRKRRKPKKEPLSPKEKRKRYLKWAFWLVIAVALYFSFGWLREQALFLLQQNPTLWVVYQAIAAEIESRSLLGLFYAASFGALFFIALPVELIFLYYLGLNYYFVQVLTITLVGNLLGIAVDYFCGWIIGPKVLQWFMKKETYEVFHRKIEKAGAFLVIVGNIIPFPIEPFTVFLGAVRYGFFRLILYTAIGKAVKFGLLWLGYKYFVLYVGPYISTVNIPWFLNLVKSSFGG